MNIHINGNYRITSDAHNIIVEERKVTSDKASNPGEERWASVSYHGTLEQAVMSLFDKEMRCGKAMEIGVLLRELGVMRDDITTALSRVKVSM